MLVLLSMPYLNLDLLPKAYLIWILFPEGVPDSECLPLVGVGVIGVLYRECTVL